MYLQGTSSYWDDTKPCHYILAAALTCFAGALGTFLNPFTLLPLTVYCHSALWCVDQMYIYAYTTASSSFSMGTYQVSVSIRAPLT